MNAKDLIKMLKKEGWIKKTQFMADKLLLIIEKANGRLWGRLTFEDNLITVSAITVRNLEKKMRKLLEDFHNLKEAEFEYFYDLTAFFEKFDFLKQSKIAQLAGVNPALLRQYASGVKYPSGAQAKKIETAIHNLAKELKSVSLYAGS